MSYFSIAALQKSLFTVFYLQVTLIQPKARVWLLGQTKFNTLASGRFWKFPKKNA